MATREEMIDEMFKQASDVVQMHSDTCDKYLNHLSVWSLAPMGEILKTLDEMRSVAEGVREGYAESANTVQRKLKYLRLLQKSNVTFARILSSLGAAVETMDLLERKEVHDATTLAPLEFKLEGED